MAVEEVPQLDRPIRYVVPRGQRGSVRANSFGELQEKLAMPYTDDELEQPRRNPREEAESRNREQSSRKSREFRGGGGGPGKGPARGGGKGGGGGGGHGGRSSGGGSGGRSGGSGGRGRKRR